MKKILAIVLAVMMLIGCMTACSSSESQSSSQSSTSGSSSSGDTSQSEEEPSGEPITLEVAVAAFNEQQEALMNEIAADYNAATGNTAEVSNMDSTPYKDKLKILVAAGDALPDIFMHWAGGPMNTYIEAGACIDLTDYIAESGLEDFYIPAATQMCTYEGRQYAFGGLNMGAEPCFYNKEMFDKYGLEEPETISDLEAICDTLLENGIIPFALANAGKWTGTIYYMYLVDRLGGADLLPNANARTGSFLDEGFTVAGNKLVEWVEKGYFPDGCNGLNHANNEDMQLLYSEQACMWLYTGPVKIKNDNPEFYEKLGVFAFPASDDGTGGNSVLASPGSNFFSISSNCKNPDDAWEFLTYLTSDKFIDGQIALGNTPPVQSAIDAQEDPLIKEMLDIVNNADNVQLYWDQYLPPALGETHKTTVQQLIGLEITPEQVNQTMEDAAIEEYGE